MERDTGMERIKGQNEDEILRYKREIGDILGSPSQKWLSSKIHRRQVWKTDGRFRYAYSLHYWSDESLILEAAGTSETRLH